MGIHHVTCRLTTSGLDNVSVIMEAMAWLCGDEELLVVDKTKSFHGPQINLVTAKIKKNKQIKEFFGKLISGDFNKILDNLEQRIDSSNTLHMRLCLDSLIGQKITFSDAKSKTVKCNVKVKVYSEQNVIDNLTEFISTC
ncbi:MAG: RNA-binding domain-containing protein [Candidatus Thermoplasmatota archaeon]|nr:RNA-binding domain-containing protein [Candidatus Thermoplasmatota archaeon]